MPSGVAVQVRLPVPYLNDKASTHVGALLFLGLNAFSYSHFSPRYSLVVNCW
ncbi:hypothetical protein [Vibrio gallaecicus]|uniref:hypothetical protein n=1 Tax=Vibrio gallaecicus TaxID=552386 RepID=UPI0025B4FA71|nr:hypothetical protein [Vibrio gallaecicus]MDN3615228.1 hypothetical protein [Vibrio gallaecicus]